MPCMPAMVSIEPNRDPSVSYLINLLLGKMMEAYGAGVPIRLTKVRFNNDYWGAERFLHE